jgi:(2Fe-2S) ferredoxin
MKLVFNNFPSKCQRALCTSVCIVGNTVTVVPTRNLYAELFTRDQAVFVGLLLYR